MTGVALALAASLSWGFADFGGGFNARRVHVAWVTALSQVAGLSLVGVLWLVTRPATPGWHELAWGAFGGATGALGLATFYRALAIGTMGIVGPIASTSAIVPVAYGLSRGEHPSLLQGVGVGLAVVGVIGASLERIEERRRLGAGVGLALVAAFGFGASLIGLNRASQAGLVWGTLSLRLTAAPILVGALLLVRPAGRGVRKALPLLVATGLFDTGANLLYGGAATRGLISVVSVLASLYPVVLVFLARIVLAERIARPQLAGVAAALAGVALISSG